MRAFTYFILLYLYTLTLWAPGALAQSATTFTPTIIPVTTGPDIANPMRGWYKWRNQEVLVPPPPPSVDAYQRYEWRTLESDPSQPLTLSAMETAYNQARANGQKFSFRIRDYVDGSTNAVPQYIINQGLATQNGSVYVPRWSDPTYQAAVRAFLLRLGQRFNNDPYIGWIDIGMYGNFGEWANAPINNVPDGSTALKSIIDAHVAAFPNQQLLVMTKSQPASALYGLSIVPNSTNNLRYPLGWRVDCLGAPGYFDFHTATKYSSLWPVMQHSWEKAPVIVEFCNRSDESPTQTATDLDFYHISGIGNGNSNRWTAWTDTQREIVRTAVRQAGYRFIVPSVVVSALYPGNSFTITTQLANVGNAPVYEDWTVSYQLKNTSGTVVWQGQSAAINLRDLNLLTSTQSRLDSFALPSSVPTDTYTLHLQATNPTRAPLGFAITGRTPTGSYSLGTITVGQGSGNPTLDLLVNWFTTLFDFNGDGTTNSQDFALSILPRTTPIPTITSTLPPATPTLTHTPTSPPGTTHEISFNQSVADFPNPERGYFRVSADSLGESNYSFVRSAGHTLARSYIRLDTYANSDQPLPATFLTNLRAGFDRIRAAKIKIIPRLAYNYGASVDANPTRMLQHLKQLQPVLADNADVIYVIPAGLVGQWGEWHGSPNYNTGNNGKGGDYSGGTSSLDTIYNMILQHMPPNRMVLLRYPESRKGIFPPQQEIATSDAFGSSPLARTGLHNDCFLAQNSWEGNYVTNPASNKEYVHRESRYVPVIGAVCQDATRLTCANALIELPYMHWSGLNYDTPNLSFLNACKSEIGTKLGYRFWLKKIILPTQITHGTTFPLHLEIANVGYAPLYNSRQVYAVLENTTTGTKTTINLNIDPRRWQPQADQPVNLVDTTVNTTGLVAGTYKLNLWLPDEATSIKNIPEYAIRLASTQANGTDVWNATTGYNYFTDIVLQ